MKTYYKIITVLFILPLVLNGCLFGDDPIDEDDLLITGRSDCYISRFDLMGTDYVNVHARDEVALIDTSDINNCTIHVEVKYGTDLKNLYPKFTLCPDAKLEPKVIGFTDFSDLNNPKKYTVISGNRKIRKTYTIYLTQQELNIP